MAADLDLRKFPFMLNDGDIIGMRLDNEEGAATDDFQTEADTIAKEEFSFEIKAQMDHDNPEVIAWEKLMSTFQQPIPVAQTNEKWVIGKQIFKL